MFRIERIITTDTNLVSKEQYVLIMEDASVILDERQLNELSCFLNNYIDNLVCLPIDHEEM